MRNSDVYLDNLGGILFFAIQYMLNFETKCWKTP